MTPTFLKYFPNIDKSRDVLKRNILIDISKFQIADELLTLSTCKECEKSASITPSKPIPCLDQTLILRLRQEPGDQVAPHVGEPGVVHVAGDDHVRPVSLSKRK